MYEFIIGVLFGEGCSKSYMYTDIFVVCCSALLDLFSGRILTSGLEFINFQSQIWLNRSGSGIARKHVDIVKRLFFAVSHFSGRPVSTIAASMIQ